MNIYIKIKPKYEWLLFGLSVLILVGTMIFFATHPVADSTGLQKNKMLVTC